MKFYRQVQIPSYYNFCNIDFIHSKFKYELNSFLSQMANKQTDCLMGLKGSEDIRAAKSVLVSEAYF